jgi:hypothetical protein
VVENAVKKYVRDEAALSGEIMSLLEVHDALSCSKLSFMTGATYRLVEQVLGDLMSQRRVTRMQRSGLKGPAHYLWSASVGASSDGVRFNGPTILSAFQRAAAQRSR